MTPEIQQREGLAFLHATSPYERDATVHALVSCIASEHADRLAAVSDQAALTYAQLHAHALGVAAALRNAGVAPGENVAILCERSVLVPAAMLGILFAGAVFVPLDPRAPLPRNTRIAELARCRAVISNGPATPAGVPVLSLDEIAPVHELPTPRQHAPPGEYEFHGPIRTNGHTGNGHAPNPPALGDPVPDRPAASVRLHPERQATDAASVMFTSGSTGEPKGVLIPHRAIVRLCRNNWFFRANPDTRFLHLSSLAFDASTLEIWAPLLNGGTVVIAPAGTLGLREIADAIRGHRVTACFLTPVLFNALVDELPSAFEPLDTVLTGGDVMSPRHAAKLRAAQPALRIINGYGPTENTTFTTCHVVEDADASAPIPIGRPISNTGVCIVDEHLSPVDPGETGELVALGDGIALGYFDDSAETGRRFVHLPHLGVRGYLTGDRGRMHEDGTIEFHGRSDAQVKIRGNRVEPAEIEALLRLVPGVRDAAVAVLREESAEQSLHAFIAMEAGESWPALSSRCMRRLRAELPEWFIPRSIARRSSMPVGQSGKLDRAALCDELQWGRVAVPDWSAQAAREGGCPASWLGAVGVLLSRAWHPFSAEPVVLAVGDMRLEIMPDSVRSSGISRIAAELGSRLHGAAAVECRLHLQTPEGLDATLVAEEELRLILPPGTSDELASWRVDHVARIWAGRGRTEGESEESVVGAAELHRIDADWNGTRWDHGMRVSLVELFEQVAAERADEEALRTDDLSISFAQLLRRSNRVANDLLRAGAARGDRVAVCDDRTVDMIAAVLGVLRIGATCVPIDSRAPASRTRLMLDDAGVAFVLLPPRGDMPVVPSSIRSIPLTGHEDPRSPGLRPDLAADAFVLFTSGSTGRPRGVPVRHESLLNRMAWMQRRFGPCVGNMVLQKTKLTWDVSIWEYMWPLAFGGRCFVAAAETLRDPIRLHECIRSNGVTVLHLVASMMPPFIRAARTCGKPGALLTICSGETLGTASAREYLDAVSGELYNLYGPTEAAIEVTCCRCDPDNAEVTIGRPVENTRISITDQAGRPCPVGSIGELRISGIQVSRAYCAAPGVSSHAFSTGPDGWASYCTGDLARWREDGSIEFIGRADAQIKLCGLRIEPEEIEAALVQHRNVADAAVCKVGHELEAELVAVCVHDPADAEADESQIRSHLRSRVDPLCVPARFVWVDALPRLANGKLDRREVVEVASRAHRARGEGVSPAEVVCDVWSMLLGSRPSAPNTHFMEAGGNSLTFLRLMLEVERRLGLELPAAPAMAQPTLGRIVGMIEAVLSERSPDGSSGISRPAGPPITHAGGLVRLTHGKTPLVVLPHIGGTLGFLNQVLPHLAGELAVYGIRPRGLFDEERPIESVEEQVKGYAELVTGRGWKHVCVMGFSSGAVFGLELARLLSDRGLRVPLLVVVDSSLQITARGRSRRFVLDRINGALGLLPGSAPRLGRAERLGQHVTESQRDLMRVHLRGLHAHTPSEFAGRALVVVRGEMRRRHHLGGWRPVLRGHAEEMVIDAGHMDMWREPHAGAIARGLLTHIRASIGEACADAENLQG